MTPQDFENYWKGYDRPDKYPWCRKAIASLVGVRPQTYRCFFCNPATGGYRRPSDSVLEALDREHQRRLAELQRELHRGRIDRRKLLHYGSAGILR